MIFYERKLQVNDLLWRHPCLWKQLPLTFIDIFYIDTSRFDMEVSPCNIEHKYRYPIIVHWTRGFRERTRRDILIFRRRSWAKRWVKTDITLPFARQFQLNTEFFLSWRLFYRPLTFASLNEPNFSNLDKFGQENMFGVFVLVYLCVEPPTFCVTLNSLSSDWKRSYK